MRTIAVAVRPATADDISEIVRISAANHEWIADDDRVGSRYAEHLLGHCRLLVAERLDAVVGFAGSIDLERRGRRPGAAVAGPSGEPGARPSNPSFAFVTDLYVDPALHGRGIGRAMLEALLEGTGDRATFSSSDPRAMPLYVRAGMGAWWPLLYLAGRPDALPTTGLTSQPVTVEEASAIELELTGLDRSTAWSCWGRRPGAGPFAIRDGERPLAVGAVARETGDPARWSPVVTRPMRLQRLVIGPDADPVEVTVAALAHGVAVDPILGLAIPGSHPALGRLFAAGYRTDGADTHLASRPDLLDPVRVLPDPSLV